MINPYLLHEKFVQMGAQRHKLKNEMLLILPQIYESGIYKKYVPTIVEYAGKYGDIARSTVIKRLRLEENLHEKPFLKEAIKDVGIHKVAMVAKLATKETDQAFADKVKNMSKSAIQTLSKELREKEQKDLCHAAEQTVKIELDSEMTFLFLKIKKKFGKNLNNREVMKMILKKMDSVENEGRKGKKRNERKIEKVSPVTTRYIPAEQKRSALKETPTKNHGQCSYPACNKPADIIHHTDRFCESKNHSSIVPLCRDHHEFMHNGIVANEKENSSKWKMSVASMPLKNADVLYRKYRKNKNIEKSANEVAQTLKKLNKKGKLNSSIDEQLRDV